MSFPHVGNLSEEGLRTSRNDTNSPGNILLLMTLFVTPTMFFPTFYSKVLSPRKQSAAEKELWYYYR